MMASKGVSVAMPEASKVADLVKDGPNGSGDGAATKDKHQQEAVLPTKLVRKSPVFFNVPCLTGLRGIAALGVVAGHLTGGTGAHIYFNGWEALQEMGNVAVLFFFVLSAFLLTVRALTERQRPADARYLRWSANGILIPWLSVRWIKYLIRRSFRILPLYWVVLVLIAAISWLHGAYGDLRNYEPFGWGRVLPYAFFYDVNSIFWTIPPEFEYYLVMPFYIVLYEMAERKDKMGEWTMGTSENPPAYPYGLGTAEIAMKEHYRKGLHNRVVHYYYRFGRRVVLLLALSLFNVLIVPIFWSARGVVNYYHIPAFMGRFWIGSLAAFIYHMFAQYGYVIYDSAPKTKNVNQKFSNLASKWISTFCDLILWLLVIGLFLSVPYYARLILRKQVPREPLSYYADNMGMWPVGGSALLVFLVSFGCRDRSFARFSSWSFFNYAGEISFPLYMTHPIAIHLTQEKEIEGIDGFLFTFGFSLVIASVLHFAVEKPVGMMAGKLAKWVQVTHFSKDPKLPVDVDKHDEIAAKRYTEMGLKPASHEAFGDTSVGDEKRTVLPVTSAVAVLQAPRGKSSGPLFQVVSIDHNEEKAQAPEYETIADEPADGKPRHNPEEETPLAALAINRSVSPPNRQLSPPNPQHIEPLNDNYYQQQYFNAGRGVPVQSRPTSQYVAPRSPLQNEYQSTRPMSQYAAPRSPLQNEFHFPTANDPNYQAPPPAFRADSYNRRY